MIGLILIAVVVGYITLAKYIINKTHEKYGTKKARHIATAIMILIPTWDVILGFPVYAYLCVFESGTKIYKTVDDVEGFYVGEKHKRHEPIMPFEGYRYVDYKETDLFKKLTGKYYRSYWLDNNTSSDCFIPEYPNSSFPYPTAFREGRCIAKKEINENVSSQWEYHFESNEKSEIPILGIKQSQLAYIKDRFSKIKIAEANDSWWRVGWVGGYFLTGWGASYKPRGIDCIFDDFNYRKFVNSTLKPKQGGNNGND